MENFSESDLITTDGYLEVVKNNPDLICYIKTDYLKNGKVPFIWRGSLHPVVVRKNAIIGHSDHSIDDSDSEWFDLIFCTNKNTSNPRVHGLPLGLPNYCDDLPILEIYGDKKMVVDISREQSRKEKLAYINFNRETFPDERIGLFEKFSNEDWVDVSIPDPSREGRIKYLRDLKESKFSFCPRGNGIDTHRLWESLYMGCIPIVKNHIAHDSWRDLPILFVEEWDQVNERYLNFKYHEFAGMEWNYEKLKISYWIKLIQNSIDEKNY